ncbi:MAG: adenylate/guanylate cyclase domain-containing protein [Verrucomicrobia bacterium]|nr:adenylate/guanylate cyclase domain-containing protein [Verrucomicrobiota bacterium]
MSDAAKNSVWLENSAGEKFPIVGNCSIGRAPTNQIALADDRASRRHALVHAQEQHEYWLVDLGSSNGTLLNGRRVSQPTLLHDGDRIEVGASALSFRQSAAAGRSASRNPISDETVLDIKSEPCWLLVADIEGSTRLHEKFRAEEIPVLTGRWLAECKQLVEECGGSINKFLGDGFFAYWQAREGSALQVTRAIEALKRLQDGSKLPFRFVLHHGTVFRGGASLGEESLSGREVNFIFRMEKLAGSLREPRLVSEMAASLLETQLPANDAGRHALPSFEGEFGFVKF